MSDVKVSFVIVTYNSVDTIEACLTSIVQHTALDFEVVIVDNSPGVETSAAAERFIASHPSYNIRLHVTGGNLGFAKGCNRGAQLSTGSYLFFLNPDTELLSDASADLLACFRAHPATYAAGPAIFGPSGTVTKTCRNLPSTFRMLLDASGIDQWTGSYRLMRFNHCEPRQVEQIMGAAMLIPAERYMQLGGMDERFFIYYEEVDLCKRMQEAGGEVWFWPAAQVRHLAGVSTEANPVRARMIYTLRDSRKKYFRKHYGASGEFWIDKVNRLEGIVKWTVLKTSGWLRNSEADREKASGFLAVALGNAPRG